MIDLNMQMVLIEHLTGHDDTKSYFPYFFFHNQLLKLDLNTVVDNQQNMKLPIYMENFVFTFTL